MSFDRTQATYQDFRSILKERSDPVVAWIGAGLSAQAGLPTWITLRDRLCESLLSSLPSEPDRQRQDEVRKIIENATTNEKMSLWEAFSQLKQHLGRESYVSEIRRAVSPGDIAAVPLVYKYLWMSGVSGMINLNIDRLAVRAFSEVNPGRVLVDFTADRSGDNIHVLRSRAPWIAHLHGTVSEARTWVFTTQDMTYLQNNSAYRTYVSSCVTTRTILFVGISADDVAAGGHLDRLVKEGVDCSGHFWLTTRDDAKTRKWAESVGVRIIRYRDTDGTHADLTEFFRDLAEFTPKDDTPPPVSTLSNSQNGSKVEDLEKLISLPTVELRNVLNAHAAELLSVTDHEHVEKYERFLSEHAEAVYRAWFVSCSPPRNKLLKYTVLSREKEGAFGTVYRACDDSGRQYAIKVLHERVREDSEMLQSFRRGVRSMRILTEQNVKGVVTYLDASEIPAMVVMDFVEGIDLSSATKSGVLDSWSDLLRVSRQLTQIIRSSHRLPQRVLHRDIRPSNVMLKNCWGRKPNWEEVDVMVLDFDLSWHPDSFDVSISQPGTANGFLAPEQVLKSGGVSSRSAAVDSFGLGMTLFFLRGKREPLFSEHLHRNWMESLNELARNFPCKSWVSLPRRFSRLVQMSTAHKQEDRLDISEIEGELVLLELSESTPSLVRSVEYLAEEVCARAFGMEYEWSSERYEGVYKFGGFAIVVAADESKRLIRLSVQWNNPGGMHHESIYKWLPKAESRMNSDFRAAGWKSNISFNTGALYGQCEVDADIVMNDIALHSSVVAKAVQAMDFR